MKILFGNMNVSAADAALKVFPEIFHAVDVRFANNIFADAVINSLVIVPFLPKTFVRVQLVSVNRRTGFDILLNDWFQRLAFAVRDNLRHHLPLALHHAKDNRLVGRSATAHAGAMTANVGFINFNVAKQRKFTVHLLHMFSDFVSHAKRAFVGHAKFPLQLHRGNAMAGSGEKVNCIEPQLHRRPAILKQRSGCRVDMMAAPLASVGANLAHPRPVRLALTLRASISLSKAAVENVLDASLVIGEHFVKFLNRQTGFLVSVLHAPNIHPKAYLRQGDNSVKLIHVASWGIHPIYRLRQSSDSGFGFQACHAESKHSGRPAEASMTT